MAAKATKRKRTNRTAKRSVRRTSQKRNPADPVGTATELVHRYWRTPRFKKDRAWLEEHLGQRRLFEYNPATVHVEKIGAKGYGVMIGKQLVGKPTPSRADAIRRVSALKATAKKFVNKRASASPKKAVSSKSKKNPSAKDVTRCKKVLAQDAREQGREPQPTVSYYRKNPGLHVIHITPGNWGVFIGKYLLKAGFKTKIGAEQHMKSIASRRKNPSAGKMAAKVAHQMLKTFDVDHSGDLDKNDIAILSHFNDPLIVIDDRNKQAGEIIAETTDGKKVIKWANEKTTAEEKGHLLKQNGFKSWRLRRKAARQYKRALKHSEKAAKAKRQQHQLEGKIKNPAQRDLHEFQLCLRKIQTAKTLRPAIFREARDAGLKTGAKFDDVTKLISKAYDQRSPQLKKNPGLISTIAEMFMGTAAAIEVGKHFKESQKRKPAKSKAPRAVPNASRMPTAAQNAAYDKFQGRPSTNVLQLVTPPGTPKQLYILGKLWELRVAGYGTLDLRGKGFYLCADPNNRQLFIGGARTARITDPVPELRDGQILPLGELTHVVYETEKSHLGDGPGQTTPYIHRMGEETGERPELAVDKEGNGYIDGGGYQITPEGIRN